MWATREGREPHEPRPSFLALAGVLLSAACSDSTPSGLEDGSPDAGTVRVTGADPTTMPLDSTFTLRVFGSGFKPDSRVVLTVNGEPTPKVKTNATLFVSPQELDASITTAADAPGGPYDIAVEGRNGKQGVGTELVDLKAHVFAISPDSARRGQPVTISGMILGSDRAKVVVTFDGIGAFVQSVSKTSIVAVVPHLLQPGMATVRVRVGGSPVSTEVNLEIVTGLVITGISPSPVEQGAEVTISGPFFEWDDVGQVSVTFDGRPGTVLSFADTTIVAVVPLGTPVATVPVEVSIMAAADRESAVIPLAVLPRRAITGLWTVTGVFSVWATDFDNGMSGQLSGSVTLSESGGVLSGDADLTVVLNNGPRTIQVIGPIVGSTDSDGEAVSFAVEGSSWSFTGQLVSAGRMKGTMSAPWQALEPQFDLVDSPSQADWEATRQ